jgi:hypothetical protein
MENTSSKIVTHLMPSAPDWDALFPSKKKAKKVKEKKEKIIKPKVVKVKRKRAQPINPPRLPTITPPHPHLLLDTLRKRYMLKSDAKLADVLHIEKSILSYVRTRKMQLTPLLTLKFYDHTNLTIEEIRELWDNSLIT